MRRKLFVLVTLLSFILSVNSFAAGDRPVSNPDFEKGTSGNVDSWSTNSYENKGEFKVDTAQKHSGNQSVCILNNQATDSRYQQEVKVEKNSYYKLSCWIKTENVGQDKKGANVSVTDILDTSNDIKGTRDWVQVVLYGKTGKKQKTMTVTVGLGGYSNVNTGKAWFDDVVVEKIDKGGVPSNANIANLYREQDTSSSSNQSNSNVDTAKGAYNTPLKAYTIFFFIFMAVLFFLVYKNIIKIPTGREKYILIALLAIAALGRIVIAPIVEGLPNDIACFKGWALSAAGDLRHVYPSYDAVNHIFGNDKFCDYPPLSILILAALGKISNALSLSSPQFTVLIKLPSMLADIATSYLIFMLARKRLTPALSVLLALAYALNPVTIIDSTLWGQVDSFFTLVIIAALLLIASRKLKLASFILACALLLKPQAIFFFPILLYEIVKRFIHEPKKSKVVLDTVLSTLIGFATAFIVALPFSSVTTTFSWLISLYKSTAGNYTYASMNAYNLFSLLGANLKFDKDIFFIFSYSTWGFIFDGLIVVYAGYLYLKSKHNSVPYFAGVLLAAGAFVLSARMHERYMFPALALALITLIFIKDRRFLYVILSFSVIIFLNANDVFYRMLTTGNPHIPAEDVQLWLMSGLNVLTFGYVIYLSYSTLIKDKIVPLIYCKPGGDKKKLSPVKKGI